MEKKCCLVSLKKSLHSKLAAGICLTGSPFVFPVMEEIILYVETSTYETPRSWKQHQNLNEDASDIGILSYMQVIQSLCYWRRNWISVKIFVIIFSFG